MHTETVQRAVADHQAGLIIATIAGLGHRLLTALGHAPSATTHQSVWLPIAGSVVSGVLVAAIIAAARLVWHRTRVPSALSRRVGRRSYLGAVRAESERPDVLRLEVYAPRLLPAGGAKSITRIQSAWKLINERDKGRVRVLTLDLEDSLHAGAELLDMGVEVRVLSSKRDLGTDGLTFHLFESCGSEGSVAIINNHGGDGDRPARIMGVSPLEVYRGRFRADWDEARPLESIIAERIQPSTATCQGKYTIRRSIEQAETTGLHLGTDTTQRVLPHLAFRDSCAVVFLLGLPGAGKSYIKGRLGRELTSMRIECRALTDYPYAYRDFVQTVLKLNSQSANGFKACDGGAFAVQNEKSLAPALRALHSDVREASQSGEVVIVEFARADLAAALQEFDDIRSRSQVIYVSAPAALRQARLASRAVPPEVRVDGETIILNLSDDHLLPASVQSALYAADSLEHLKASTHWRDRIFEINNELNGGANIDAKIKEFIDGVVDLYR